MPKKQILRYRSPMKALSRWLYNRLDFFSEMFLTKPIPFVRNSNPMLSDSSIRRLKRQRIIPQRCRNQDAGLSGPMSRARLALRGRHRFPIGFSFLKHPEACLREVAGNSHFGFAMAPPWLDPLVKPADMIVATTLAIKDRAVSRLNKGHFKYTLTSRRTAPKRIFPPLECSRGTNPQ